MEKLPQQQQPDSKWAVRLLSDWGANVKLQVDDCCFIFLRVGIQRSALPCWKEHVLFLSLCYFTLGGGWRQLRAPAAERAPSLCTSISITSATALCVHEEHCMEECPQVAAFLAAPSRLEYHHDCNLLKGLESERRSLFFPLRINFHHLIAAFITGVQ